MSRPKDKWTKRELTLRSGIIELAKAVVEQWIEDGKPEKDAEVIKFWQAIITFEEKEQ